ncbi:hypothetical protein CONPUDRAFT_157521 [Coniophora puteana RWD-64-598 SS2]|uniref:CxC5 like cysteine cluster associated with KDZ domain-containing protein n=1 Tax=Coniophora puteana (strain RWD-64-598) TaxID=741705 RepID=A0A5M3MEC5_CONPW|nr:uncharacterized protein CONPUDRAFT_157521 [Coniophora puteana RWD-64-598 SS2]EIW77260.1 hypothetical protein CONPUDRAFT_157521 [Coniophora puteana RWD-64-598 SS2]
MYHTLAAIATVIANLPILLTVTLSQLLLFFDLCALLKDDIALIHPDHINTITTAPPLVPEVHLEWIATTVGLSNAQADALWTTFRETIWAWGRIDLRLRKILDSIEAFGWRKGICCGTNYRNNYSVSKPLLPQDPAFRVYYDQLKVPIEYYQVTDHHYVDAKLANMWTHMMAISTTAATSCAKLYEATFAHQVQTSATHYFTRPESAHFVAALPFSPKLTVDHVWTAFTIHALLRDAHAHHMPFIVPHDGEQAARFNTAMHQRNLRIIQFGQDAARHCCNVCMRIWDEVDPSTGIIIRSKCFSPP